MLKKREAGVKKGGGDEGTDAAFSIHVCTHFEHRNREYASLCEGMRSEQD